MSLPRRRRLVEIARERELLVLEDNPYGLLRYEGEPLPPLCALDGGEFVHLPRHVLEDPLARHPARLGRRRRAPVLDEDQPRQAGRRPLHLVADAAVRRRLLRARATGATTCGLAARALPRAAATRCSTRWPSSSRREAEWTQPERRPVHLGDAARLHRHRPTCSRGRCARTSRSCPGAAAYLDGRGGSSMRLNFSGVGRGRHPRGRPPHRQGRRRAGRALRHAHRRAAPAAAEPAPAPPMPTRRRARAAARARARAARAGA